MDALDVLTGGDDTDVKIVVADALALAVDVGSDEERTKDPTKLLAENGKGDDTDLKIIVADALALAVDVGEEEEEKKGRSLLSGGSKEKKTEESGDVKIIVADAIAVAIDGGE